MVKKYSLALWWWAARGLAHIWVIKYIEEKQIKINEVSGTSMWAIIGALYAIWKTSTEMIYIAKDISYIKLIDMDFKEWLLKWKKVYEYLYKIFWDTKIEDLNIKLKIVATNLENGSRYVFTEWKIIDAIRASISLPWIFIPYKIDSKFYMDWWIVNNLPIEVLDWIDIIAISALKQVDNDLKRTRKILWIDFNLWFFNLNFQILQRTIIFMMKQNELRSLEVKWKNIILVEPDYWNLDFHSFTKVDKFVNIWYNKISSVFK